MKCRRCYGKHVNFIFNWFDSWNTWFLYAKLQWIVFFCSKFENYSWFHLNLNPIFHNDFNKSKHVAHLNCLNHLNWLDEHMYGANIHYETHAYIHVWMCLCVCVSKDTWHLVHFDISHWFILIHSFVSYNWMHYNFVVIKQLLCGVYILIIIPIFCCFPSILFKTHKHTSNTSR